MYSFKESTHSFEESTTSTLSMKVGEYSFEESTPSRKVPFRVMLKRAILHGHSSHHIFTQHKFLFRFRSHLIKVCMHGMHACKVLVCTYGIHAWYVCNGMHGMAACMVYMSCMVCI